MQDDCFKAPVRFGNFAIDGDDLLYQPPEDKDLFKFDFTESFGYCSHAFEEQIQKEVSAENLAYMFFSNCEDIASPDSVSKEMAKELLIKISFGSLVIQEYNVFFLTQTFCSARLMPL